MPVFGVGDDMHPDEVISQPRKASKELALLEGFLEVPDAADLTPAEAMTLVRAIESVSEVDIDRHTNGRLSLRQSANRRQP